MRSYDTRPQLLGRGTTGPYPSGFSQGPMHLWDHFRPPAAQNSLLVYEDGTVLEGQQFTTEQINDSSVIAFIYGGTDYRCEPGPVHDALIAAGYTCGWGVDIDLYPGDDEYPVDDTYPLEQT